MGTAIGTFPQFNLPELAGRSARDRFEKLEAVGKLPLGERTGEVRAQLVGARRFPCLRTTQARGRSPHFGSAIAITAASCTAACAIRRFSMSTELIHSPPDLIKSLVRSAMRR